MKNILLYGAGNNYIFSLYEVRKYYNCVGVVDKDSEKIGKTMQGMLVGTLSDYSNDDYDYIVITPTNSQGIREDLLLQGIRNEKIIDLQEAFDIIPNGIWLSERRTESEEIRDASIAIILYGGMGDLLVGKLWIEKLMYIYGLPIERLNLFTSDQNLMNAKIIFNDLIMSENIKSIEHLNKNSKEKYGAILRFCIVPEVLQMSSSLKEVLNNEMYDYFIDLKSLCDKEYNRGFYNTRNYYKTIQKYLVKRKGAVYHTAYDLFENLDAKATDKCSSYSIYYDGESILKRIGVLGKRYITLNTGLNNEYIKKRNTREWPFVCWDELANSIKKCYPDLIIVQVGLKIRDEDDIEADIHLNGKTNLPEIAAILKHSIVHIDYDGGLVHVNHIVGGISIVLMGPSSIENHAYPENIYVSNGECCGCEWITSDWLSNCPKGYGYSKCMSNIKVEKVMEAIRSFLED